VRLEFKVGRRGYLDNNGIKLLFACVEEFLEVELQEFEDEHKFVLVMDDIDKSTDGEVARLHRCMDENWDT
jgi:hypothetical protein